MTKAPGSFAPSAWHHQNSEALKKAAKNVPAGLPSNLTPHEQGCAEPLLHIADLIGGPWPERARAAVAAVLTETESTLSIQVLSDVRSWFYLKNNPEYLFTRDLLTSLITQENRPWGGWSTRSGRKLGALLHPFGVFSRNLWDGKVSRKGYLLKDFQDSWERYLAPLPKQPSADAVPKTN